MLRARDMTGTMKLAETECVNWQSNDVTDSKSMKQGYNFKPKEWSVSQDHFKLLN